MVEWGCGGAEVLEGERVRERLRGGGVRGLRARGKGREKEGKGEGGEGEREESGRGG